MKNDFAEKIASLMAENNVENFVLIVGPEKRDSLILARINTGEELVTMFHTLAASIFIPYMLTKNSLPDTVATAALHGLLDLALKDYQEFVQGKKTDAESVIDKAISSLGRKKE